MSQLIRARKAGTATITATVEGVTGSATVTVTAKPPEPTPPPPTPPVGDQSQRIGREVTDFRGTDYTSGTALETERRFTASKYGVVMNGDPRAYKSIDSTVQVAPYQIVLAIMQTAQKGDIDALNAFYAARGWNVEDAFLHVREPRTQANRVQFDIWGSRRWATNAGHPTFREFITERIKSRIHADTQYPADGIFIDEHDEHNIGRIWRDGGGCVEYAGAPAFHDAITGLWQYVRPRLSGKYIQLNPAEFVRGPLPVWAKAAGQIHYEHFHHARREVHSRWGFVDGMVGDGVITQLVANTTIGSYDKLTDAEFPAGIHKTKGARGKTFELASYLMCRAVDPKMVRFTNLNAWSEPFSKEWLPIYDRNLGAPLGPRSVPAGWSGTDKSGLPYQVFLRMYEKAMVVCRSVNSWEDENKCGAGTAVTVTLPRSGRFLHADGSEGSTMQSVSLMNGDAAILLL